MVAEEGEGMLSRTMAPNGGCFAFFENAYMYDRHIDTFEK